MTYLKNEQYYADLYDLFTIERCLRHIGFSQKEFQNKDKHKEFSNKERVRAFSVVTDLGLYFIKGGRYAHRQETIQKLYDDDKKRQDFYDNTPEPSDIHCDTCGRLLQSDFKHLEDVGNKPWRVLFYFPCTFCRKKKAIFNTGEEYVSTPDLCEKCGHEIERSYKRKGKIITTLRKCIHCDFSETEVEDFDKSHKEWEEKQKKDRELLSKYRHEFCMSDKEGQEYIQSIESMKSLNEMLKKHEKKEGDPAYHRAKKLKKLSIVELEKILTETLEKEKYIKLSLDKPEMGKYVVVPFTVQDADSSRKEHESTGKLRKLIKKTLEDTNWRLMTEGASYRLGYVYGRLKGYEREEDLMEIVRKKNENPPLMETEDGPIY
jgi:hypothetical protein